MEYGLWASKKWLTYLDEHSIGDPDRTIFQHILASTEVWARRVNGDSPMEMPKPEVSEATLEAQAKTWIDILQTRDLGEWIHYKRTTGEEFSMELGIMAQHVINHGTYHRGELRGLCRARGDNEFPDTDIAAYAFDIDLAK